MRFPKILRGVVRRCWAPPPAAQVHLSLRLWRKWDAYLCRCQSRPQTQRSDGVLLVLSNRASSVLVVGVHVLHWQRGASLGMFLRYFFFERRCLDKFEIITALQWCRPQFSVICFVHTLISCRYFNLLYIIIFVAIFIWEKRSACMIHKSKYYDGLVASLCLRE